MKPLYMKLRDREYDKNQILDKESILWLKKELKLKEKVKPLKIDPIKDSAIIQYVPKKSWFYDNRFKTIHGFSHILRVMLYSYSLCKLQGIDRFEPYLIAASIHDVKRTNDKEDKGHGKRASAWFYHQKLDIKNNLSAKEIKEICMVVKDHEKKFSGYSENLLKVYNILKCADALDRYRLPKRKWWLKKELLPLPVSMNIIKFSKHFTFKTEEEIIKGKDPLKAILDLAKKYNLVF